MRLEEIRKAERESHEEVYSSCKLYESGSWLQKPIITVLNLLPEFAEHEEIRVLDLGGGVGRNCIPFAKEYKVKKLLEKAFTGWELIKTTVSKQNYDIPRDSCIAELSTNVVTYVARKML